MGRKKLIEGVACRYGHAWNRSENWKRCLTCYPPPPPRAAPTPKPAPRRPSPSRTPEEQRAHENTLKQRRRALLRELNPLPPRKPAMTFEERKRHRRDSRRRLRQLASLLGPVPSRVGRSKPLRQRLFDRQRGKCALTGLSMLGAPTHIDHIVPRSLGGSDKEDNLQLVLRAANMAKGNNSCAWLRGFIVEAARSIENSNLAT